MANGQSRRSLKQFGVLIVIVGAVFVLLASFRAGPPPSIAIEAGLPGIGRNTPIEVRVDEAKRGLSVVAVEFVQGERVHQLEARTYTPREPWAFWGERTQSDEFTLQVGSETLENLKEGPATIRVLADRAGSWLRSPEPAVQELTLEVRLRPPALQVLSSFTYVKQGGCEAVVYTLGESAVRDGVQAGDWWFPGYPLPQGGKGQRFALFSAPYDLGDASLIRLVAEDDVGNESRVSFIDRFNERPPRTDRIPLSDAFMERVVPAILAQSPEIQDRGNLLDTYLAINGELRSRNAQTIIELSHDSAEQFLWTQRFLQMRNAQVMSDFADRRTYVYKNEAVDEQDHLGFDLASTRAAPIEAANDGIVVLARYFGIYGNAVVIDHGYGLMSLYGHLSSLEASEGQPVSRGDVIGRSGESGLAGGDHLHFTMLLHGLPVDPREWWDSHWISDRLKLKLGRALPFEG